MANLNKKGHKASDNHQTNFFEAEFNAWDKQNRGYLTMEEYVNLFEFLQYGNRSEIIVSIRYKTFSDISGIDTTQLPENCKYMYH